MEEPEDREIEEAPKVVLLLEIMIKNWGVSIPLSYPLCLKHPVSLQKYQKNLPSPLGFRPRDEHLLRHS